MHILPVVDVNDAPALPDGYLPSPWALAVAVELERLMMAEVKLVLVHLEPQPRIRHVSPSKSVRLSR